MFGGLTIGHFLSLRPFSSEYLDHIGEQEVLRLFILQTVPPAKLIQVFFGWYVCAARFHRTALTIFRRVWRLTDRLWVFVAVAVLALTQTGELLVSSVKQPPPLTYFLLRQESLSQA